MKKIVLVFILGLGCTQFFSCSKKAVELDYNAQLKKDETTIDAYLASHSITAIKDTTGLRYIINVLGTGAKPTLIGNVSVKYSATIFGATAPFDQTNGASFPLSGLIAGWQIALPKIPKGSVFTLYLPSGLAYGSAGVPGVPGNSIIIFDITLFDDDAQLIADVAAIDAYLAEIGTMDIQTDPSGIRYKYTIKGTGTQPISTSLVNVTYSGRLLTPPQSVFDSQKSSIGFALSDVIPGWRIALVKVPAGSQITLYVPSGLAYGPAAKTTSTLTIPANSNLIFDINLISVN